MNNNHFGMNDKLMEAYYAKKRKEKWQMFGFNLLVVACLFACGFGYYQFCDFKAQRFNEQLGTHYTAVDIMMGVHKTARDWR